MGNTVGRNRRSIFYAGSVETMTLQEAKDAAAIPSRRSVLMLSPSRAARALVSLVVALALIFAATPANAATPAVACTSTASAATCDSDADRIPDSVERVMCGTATCATGAEDSDADGIPDWVEITACGSATCADPNADSDGDGIPDYAEQIVCGTTTCATGDEDADGDGIPDWIEVVICGDTTCSTGTEDLNHDGIADAAQLKKSFDDAKAAREKAAREAADDLAHTGLTVVLPIGLATMLLFGGLVVFMARRNRRAVVAASGAPDHPAGESFEEKAGE
ncbi:protein of unknown function [Agreia sp. COWG]|nr:protein of unknown function [Agreia sp. COWG]